MKIINSNIIIDNDTFEPILEVTVQLPVILLRQGAFDWVGGNETVAYIIGEEFLNAYEKYTKESKKEVPHMTNVSC